MTFVSRTMFAFLLLSWATGSNVFADVKILLPQGRSAFQTNEWIDISVVRSDAKPPGSSTLDLSLHGADGGRIATSFAVKWMDGKGKATEHFHVNGRLLRPGKYKVEVAVDEWKAFTEIEVYSHLRQSDFKLINWGRATKSNEQLIQGEDSLGFNTFYGHYGADEKADFIRAGVDYIANCVMSGGHQMDLRLECDWSDPYVTRGGARRVVKRAMIDRTRPNVPGVHFYDEPGLTWGENPANKDFTPHAVFAQKKSYLAAFDKEPLDYTKVDPKNPEHAARWKHWIMWRLGIMDAAWKESQFGVSQVRPDYLSLTQSQYGWTAFTDGYYFNVARSLPITSGHGGYHDFGPGIFNPSLFLEMARARDQWKPCWYLPTWYGNTTSDQYRCEQYLAFQTNIQGMMSPPDLEPATNPSAREGIVESNHVMKRLGPVFYTMSPAKPQAAMLYSLSQCIHTQTQDRKKNYAHEMPQGRTLPFTYLTGKLIQQPFAVVLDEDVIDGTLANDHKAVILSSIDYLDPQVIDGLERFIQGGGRVLMTSDSTVAVKGAIKLNITPKLADQELIDKWAKEKGKENLVARLQSTAKYLEAAWPFAQVIKGHLDLAGIPPVAECDNKHIVITRQGSGDIDYFFAVNTTPDADDTKDVRTALKSATASLGFQTKGGLYDALVGGLVGEFREVDQATFQADIDRAAAQRAATNARLEQARREAERAVRLRDVKAISEEEFTKTIHAKKDAEAALKEAEDALKRARLGPRGEREVKGTFRFGPGQMRVFARTARPIGGLSVAKPVVQRDLVLEKEPITVEIAASLVDDNGRLLSGSAPMQIQVLDPFGAVRHELYRATKLGQFSIRLPLAANDPPGQWKVVVRELLNNSEDTATFIYTPPHQVRAIAGATPRAVSYIDDAERAFRFGRMFHDVTIVKGMSPFNDTAAKRLAKILEPWGIRCKTMELSEAAKARSLSEEEARSFVGLNYAAKAQIKPGDANPAALVGFAVRGPVFLLGNPDDNPIIAFLQKEKFLPYNPDKANFPGPGRGYFAWQRDALGAGQESIALIAYDEDGMKEAVGTLYEAIAGIEGLTRWTLPTKDVILPAKTAPEVHPVLPVAWSVNLPDRIDFIKVDGKVVTAITHDNSRSTIGADGKLVGTEPLKKEGVAWETKVDAETQALAQKYGRSDRLLKFALSGPRIALAYWGGTLRLIDKAGAVISEQRLPQDVTAMTWLDNRVIVGLSDGRVMALDVK